MKINLSKTQEKIVNHENGALLVMASAGTGKTRVLTERIKKLLKLSSKKILAITFTNKAGAEMKERLGDDEEILKRVFIGTFHSFCQQILEQRCNLIGYSKMPQIFESINDRLELIEEAINNVPSFSNRYKNLDDKKKRNFKYDALGFISKAKRELWSDDQVLENENEDYVLLCNEYNDILLSQNAIDFDDLIKLTYELFINNPAISALYRRSYEYICVDEAQDLNNAQYYLLKAITGDEHKNVMMIGDENQSIYAFNGSSADYMSKSFKEDFAPTEIDLVENYRSSKKVIEAAQKITKNSGEITNVAIIGEFEIVPNVDEIAEINWITEKIETLISQKTHDDIEGEINYEKIAILVRNKYVFGELTKEFDSKGIPYYFKISPGPIEFESDAINVFDLALKVKLNTKDKLHWDKLLRIVNVEECSDLHSLINKTEIVSFKKALILVSKLNEDGSNFIKLLTEFSQYISESTDFNNDDERNMTFNDTSELKSHWYQYAKTVDEKSLRQFKNAMALGQTYSDTKQNGITLSTVHTMKGLEYDIVFLMGADDGTFPDYRAVQKGGVELLQEKNNMYVAFTRARRFLYVSYPKKRLMPWGDEKVREISRFLENIKTL